MPWEHRGQRRPAYAIEPGPGQESVWDYPRPPRLVADPRRVEVRIGESLLAHSTHAIRVLETASPPTFYLPRADVRMELLRRAAGHSYCEWKGQATYFDAIDDGRVIERAAWSYENPTPPFSAIAGYLSFYPGRIACKVEGERVRPQPGAFYGGWVTDEIVGPYKGEAGTGGW
ncbi:MAG: DUF427 domain-containing protein [Chromatiaceae bacterium]